jgi:hypothetical protein
MNKKEYLQSWEENVKSNPNYEEFVDYRDIYLEMISFLDDHIEHKNIPVETAINMCSSMLINFFVEAGVCPACEFFVASDTIHKEMGCTDVH